MLPRVFEIDEILRHIASDVIDLSGSSAISLASCCKALEEPVLSLCWEEKPLDKLANVLPTGVLKRSGLENTPYYVCTSLVPQVAVQALIPILALLQSIIRFPTREEQRRLLRYASWIKRIAGIITRRIGALLEILRFCSPTETPFPNLRGLNLCIYPSFLRFLPLFISPRVTAFSVSVYSDASFKPNTLERDDLSAAVAALPPFLREFALRVNLVELGSDGLKEEIQRVVQRSGPTLTRIEIDVKLPTTAIHHLVQLPNLRTWKNHGNPPPAAFAPSYEEVTYLPALCSFALEATNTHDWVVFLAGSYQTATTIRPTLTKLNLSGHQALDPILIAQVCAFTNLTHLHVGCTCPTDRCVFTLTDDDLSSLSLALPRLESLMLGHQCDKNTCGTTFKSLLFLSTRCPGLVSLSIHFNTLQIAQDIRSLFSTGDPTIKALRESPTRCRVSVFSVSHTPLSLVGLDELDVVKKGFMNVFPQLRGISRKYGRAWQSVTEALGK